MLFRSDDNGRMRDDEGEGADWEDHESTPAAPQESWLNTWWSQQQWWQWDRDRDDSWSRHQWRQPNETPSLKYGVSSQASAEADKFLPDFVVAWMLLQRSKLDGAERATIISSLKNEFTTSRVTEVSTGLKMISNAETNLEDQPCSLMIMMTYYFMTKN